MEAMQKNTETGCSVEISKGRRERVSLDDEWERKGVVFCSIERERLDDQRVSIDEVRSRSDWTHRDGVCGWLCFKQMFVRGRDVNVFVCVCVCGAWCLAKVCGEEEKEEKEGLASHQRSVNNGDKGSTIGNFSCDNVSSCVLWCPVHFTHLKGTPRLFHRVVHILNVGRLGKKERQVRATTQDRSCPVLSCPVQYSTFSRCFFHLFRCSARMDGIVLAKYWILKGVDGESKGKGETILSQTLSRFLNGCLFPCLLACTGMMCAWGLHHQDGVSDDMCMMRNIEDNEM